MNLTTVQFSIFVMLVLAIYYVIPTRHQWKCILVSNFVFLWFAGWASVWALLLIGLISYASAILIGTGKDRLEAHKNEFNGSAAEKKKTARELKNKLKQRNVKILIVGIALIFSLWMSAKAGIIRCFTPLAISYYAFIAISYLADVCQGKYRPEKNFAKYLTFLSFFPQLTEGPFSRYESLSRDLGAPHAFSMANLEQGVLRMLYGYVKKLILADSLWLLITPLLEQDYANNWSTLLLVILLPLQQYADFSGCMDIVIGLANLFGISLPENFHSPIFSKSIDEVWRRWHITLGAFCKDYIFYPVALNRSVNKVGKSIGKKSKKWGRFFPVLMSLLCVWTFMGIWHGLAWKYLIWGWMNLLIIGSSLILENRYKIIKSRLHIHEDSQIYTALCICRTYLLFGMMEYMADGSSASWALRGWRMLLTRTGWSQELFKDMLSQIPASVNLLLCGVITVAVLVIDVLQERKVHVVTWIQRRPIVLKSMIYLLLVYTIVLFIPNGVDINAGFAYANF